MAEGGAAGASDSPALMLENRRRLFDVIKRTPGIHLREVVRALALPYGTAEYHLRVLEQEGLVRSVADDNFRRYYPADFALADRAVLGLLRKRPIRRIVMALLERGQLTHQDLAETAGLKPSTLSYHLTRLEQLKVLRMRREGRFTLVTLLDPPMVTRLFAVHGHSFADGAVERFLETWAGFELPPPAAASAAPAPTPTASPVPAAQAEPALEPERVPETQTATAPDGPPLEKKKEKEEGG